MARGSLYLCGICGESLRATTAGTGGRGRGHIAAYRCEHGAHVVRRCEPLDEFVEAVAVERLSRQDAAELGRPPATADTSSLHVERLAIQARLEELVDRFAAGQITGQQMERGSTTLRAQLDDLDRQLAAAAGTSVLDGVTGPAVVEVWSTLDLSRRRAVIDTLMAVTVNPLGVGVHRDGDPASPTSIRAASPSTGGCRDGFRFSTPACPHHGRGQVVAVFHHAAGRWSERLSMSKDQFRCLLRRAEELSDLSSEEQAAIHRRDDGGHLSQGGGHPGLVQSRQTGG
jgi:hypothetical protein